MDYDLDFVSAGIWRVGNLPSFVDLDFTFALPFFFSSKHDMVYAMYLGLVLIYIDPHDWN